MFSSIHKAAAIGDVGGVLSFLNKGESPNYQRVRPHHDKATPLHLAANVEVASLLVERGADVHAKMWGDRTPLSEASYDGRVDVVRFLLGMAADPCARVDGEGVLHRAVRGVDHHNAFEIVLLLLDRGADPNDVRQTHGLSPLMLAARWGHLDIVQLMVDSGGDPFRLRDKASCNALDQAARCMGGGCKYQVEVVQFLCEYIDPKSKHILIWAVLMMQNLLIYHHLSCQSMIDLYDMMGNDYVHAESRNLQYWGPGGVKVHTGDYVERYIWGR